MADSRALFQLLLDELRVKTSQITLPVSSATDFPDMGLRTHLFGETSAFCETLPSLDWSEGDRSKVYLLKDRYLCRYFLCMDTDTGKCWLIGPYLIGDPTLRDITILCKKLNLPAEHCGFLQTYYKIVPKLKDQNMVEALFRSYAALQYGQESFELIQWEMEAAEKPALVRHTSESSPDLHEFLERTYINEQRMMDCITKGNYDGAAALYTKLQPIGIEARTDSSLRDGKNSIIVLNSLCRVAAYAGGVHPFELDRWTREFIIRIESATSILDIKPLSILMLKKYCDLVRSVDGVRYSPVIRKVVDYISRSFNSTITLKAMADQFGINSSYLSTLFKKETGKSFTEYIMETRMTFAMQLLLQTDLPISAIAVECGIPDNNYFARIFKTRTGVSPLQYRQNNL